MVQQNHIFTDKAVYVSCSDDRTHVLARQKACKTRITYVTSQEHKFLMRYFT